jgi:hypothetical protein
MIPCRSLVSIPVDKPYPLRWTLTTQSSSVQNSCGFMITRGSYYPTEWGPSQPIGGNPFSQPVKKATEGFEDCPVIACCASNMLRCTARLLIDAWLWNQEGRPGSLVCSLRLLAAPVGMKFPVWQENLFDGQRGNNQISASEPIPDHRWARKRKTK